MNKPRILLAMPCAHGLVKMGAMRTITECALTLAAAGCEVAVTSVSASDLVYCRNHLAWSALQDECTHLFFIDADMLFPRELAMTLLQADKDLVGLIYPRTSLDLQRIVDISRSDPDLHPLQVVSKAHDYVVRLSEMTRFSKGMGQVAGIGMGGALIKTSALRTMIDRGVAQPLPPRHSFGVEASHWSFFDQLPAPDGGVLPEDFSFCQRWLNAGGEVWGLASPLVRRTGDFAYVGDILASLGRKAPT